LSIELSFWVLGGLAIAAVICGQILHRNPLNPLSVFAVVDIGLFTLFSAVMTRINVSRFAYDDGEMLKTVGISIAYALGFVLPFLFHGPLPANAFAKGLRLLGLGAQKVATRFSLFKFAMLLVAPIGAFWIMAELGDGGKWWLTDPRLAYLSYRTGVGRFYALTQWSSMFALFYYLWSRRPRGPAHSAGRRSRSTQKGWERMNETVPPEAVGYVLAGDQEAKTEILVKTHANLRALRVGSRRLAPTA
jgi:hypothetical protein